MDQEWVKGRSPTVQNTDVKKLDFFTLSNPLYLQRSKLSHMIEPNFIQSYLTKITSRCLNSVPRTWPQTKKRSPVGQIWAILENPRKVLIASNLDQSGPFLTLITRYLPFIFFSFLLLFRKASLKCAHGSFLPPYWWSGSTTSTTKTFNFYFLSRWHPSHQSNQSIF